MAPSDFATFFFDRSATRTLFFVVFNGVVLFIADILFAAGGVCSHICLLFLSSFLRVLVWQIQFVISEKCQMKTMVDEIVIKNCEITKIVTHHCVLRLLTTWWERTLWQMLVLLLTRSLGRSERGRVPTRCLGRRGWLRLSLLTYKVFGKEMLPLQADPGWFTYSWSCVTHVLWHVTLFLLRHPRQYLVLWLFSFFDRAGCVYPAKVDAYTSLSNFN